MKIYFSSAISNVSDEIKKYQNKIVEILEDLGHVVLLEHRDGRTSESFANQSEDEAMAIHRKISKWPKQVYIMVVEASIPSFGVGQEITEALNDNKQVIVMYLKGYKPHILMHQGQDLLYFVEYTDKNIKDVLVDYIEYTKAHSDTRFNFFISPQIGSYLDWISQKKKLPRAVYLRRLIEEDMKLNKEYDEA
jgi:hypothetical protein